MDAIGDMKMKRIVFAFCLLFSFKGMAKADLINPAPGTVTVSSTNTWTGGQTFSSATIINSPSITVSTLTPTNIVGNTSGLSTPVGDVGEQIAAYGTSVAVPTGNYIGITTVTLTTGYWSVSATYCDDNVAAETGFNSN